ncbi:DUF6520 family protein [Flavobacterium turcicum]|uniref:Uncharacterized protein n=1 Tax=Flavobacterium turcicum TaxID=2764718 RepID=A0ABR7JEA1_9FLAO|nr:DUF6520 family protein [Flavobacterium turcicum]MBC5862835.1 hypothetical protein [Flavobacterium turcicum]NHL01567.1 hypothetical protein [Flavobacterium turcicum]
MKTNFAKQVLPVAVFALAIAGAFTTNAMSQRSKTVAPVQGFIKLNLQATSCEQRDMCSNVNNGIVCTVGLVPSGAQLFGKNSSGQCSVPIYRP